MPKPVKLQWDFGELFPAQSHAAQRKVLSVTELTWKIKRLLEQRMGEIWVTGEITNLRLQNSGHIYFTLKDAGAQLSCVLFRGAAQVDRSLLQDGRKVTLQGEVTVYEPRGQYQLRVTKVELQGVGALQAAFEKLKQRLKAEGWFAPERKRPLPRYPQCIGLVTSPTGAAIRDVLHVVKRRNPALEIILAPCRVQGEGAADEIASAIRLLNEFGAAQGTLDLILVTRGGGSLEDLWAFNEEVVARAIFESRLPVVSAVGHEIDFTISDFVADLRAATPSAAAEVITEGVFSSSQFLAESAQRIRQLVGQQMDDRRYELTQTVHRLARVHPRRRLNDWLQRLDDAQASLLRCVKQAARQERLARQSLSDRLARVRPALLLRQRREVLSQLQRRLREETRRQLELWRSGLGMLDARLRLLGPEQVLARGYSITMDGATGKVLRKAGEVKAGQRLKTRLKVGEVFSKAEQ
ncbi:MAG TPA: exodeoxyribonuclease VII large subunit [Candidatus Paceibacterota bacterium]|nr:exodeoxyribonuclease VII large subunit [Verrucomicrobiota bacterium]HSA12814.1 exodeoxyribonuclease VII large subunit [Candidatus Paceibacterota bacterium]